MEGSGKKEGDVNVNTWHQENTPNSWEVILEGLKDFESPVTEINEKKKSAPIPTETLKKFFDLHNTLVAETDKISHSSEQNASIDISSGVLDNIFIEAIWLSLDQYPAIANHPKHLSLIHISEPTRPY